MYLKLPKYVRQNTLWSCWAAGLESWLDAAPYGRRATQRQLIEEYATHANGGLEPLTRSANAHRDFETLADDFSISFVVMRGRDLSIDYIEERLNHGHVLLIYNLRPGVAHTNVVYGVGYPTGQDRLISVMDPSVTTSDPHTGLYRNRPISFYNRRSAVIVGWPR